MEKSQKESISKRVPAKHSPHERDEPSDRFPKGARRKLLKSMYKSAKKVDPNLTLRRFARSLASGADTVRGAVAKRWFQNKKANTKKPQLGIGRTRKK